MSLISPSSPLKQDQAYAKELKLVDDLTVNQKLILVNAQIDEFKKVIFRNRIDILLSTNLLKSEDHMLASKGAENDRNFRFQARQMAEGLGTLIQLRDELDKLAEKEAA
jgi:hypothetical protein